VSALKKAGHALRTVNVKGVKTYLIINSLQMEDYLMSQYKKNFDMATFKVNFIQGVKGKILACNKRFKLKFNKSRVGRKDFFLSLCKHYYLLEKLVLRIISQKMKDHQETTVDPFNYEEVIKKDKAEKKYRKGLFKLQEEVKYVRHVKLALEEKRKELQDQENNRAKKLETIEHMQAKARQRHEENEKLKRIWSVTPDRSKPRFLQMEENFKINAEFSEAQRTRSELAKKSQFMKAVHREELSQHAKNYDRVINEAKKKREAKLAEVQLDSSINSVNIFKRSVIAEREEVFSQKKNMAAKRKNYGDIVRELFSPKIDLKAFYSERVEVRKPTPISFREKEGRKSPVLTTANSVKITKKIPRPQCLTPKNEKIEEVVKPKNYLKELRVKRNGNGENFFVSKIYNSFTSGEIVGDRRDVLKKLKSIEKFALNEENKIKWQEKNTPRAIEMESRINDLLIQSVKAKVQMLEN
jgi:hypothetical protein